MLNNRTDTLNPNDLFYVEYTISSFNKRNIFLHLNFNSVEAAQYVFNKMESKWDLPVSIQANRIVIFPDAGHYRFGACFGGDAYYDVAKVSIHFSNPCLPFALYKLVEPIINNNAFKKNAIMRDLNEFVYFYIASDFTFEKRLIATKKMEDCKFSFLALSHLLNSGLLVNDVVQTVKLFIMMDASPDLLKYSELRKQFPLNTQSVPYQEYINEMKMTNNDIMQDIDLIIDYLNNGFTTHLHSINFFASVGQSEKREWIKNLKIACLNSLKECIAEFLYMGGSLNDAINFWKETSASILNDDLGDMEGFTMYEVICCNREGEKIAFPTKTAKMIEEFKDKYSSSHYNCNKKF